MGSEDHRLILQCQAGDQAAFAELVKRYQRRVYGVARGMVRDRDDAMDITQEAFIRVHRHLDRFAGSAGFYTWLYRIVVNLCFDHLRKKGRHRQQQYDDAKARGGQYADDLLPCTIDPNPERALWRRHLRAQVQTALQTLSPAHRAAILLREIEGLSYAEMARAMHCSQGTVMSRLFYARRNMQRALAAVREETPDAVAPAASEHHQRGTPSEAAQRMPVVEQVE